MSHTPGPWEMQQQGTDFWVDTPCSPPQNRQDICRMSFRMTDRGVSEANARLIAAAPELLQALLQCQSWLREYHTQHGSPMDDGLFALDEQVSEAIAKATGQ